MTEAMPDAMLETLTKSKATLELLPMLKIVHCETKQLTLFAIAKAYDGGCDAVEMQLAYDIRQIAEAISEILEAIRQQADDALALIAQADRDRDGAQIH
jgi:hypothetical protein